MYFCVLAYLYRYLDVEATYIKASVMARLYAASEQNKRYSVQEKTARFSLTISIPKKATGTM